MEASALGMLEFAAIAERLAEATSTSLGALRARGLVPSADEEEVARRQALTTEAIALLDESAEPPLRGIRDVREAAQLAARGALLTPGALRDVATTISGGLAARAALEAQRELAPLLHGLSLALEPGLAPLANAIGRCVEDDGADVRDSASPKLRRLRKELREGRQRVADELRRLARGSELREHLQEDFVTHRGGRPVLAVKASARRSVPGIVHDASASGQTLFVEPFEVVELSNRQSEVAGAEREEVERILRELSAKVGASAAALETLVETTAAIDVVAACATLSRGWRGAPVERSDEVRLRQARHPLLDRETAVPIDLELGELRALVISGPNAGGKTVALKTLGLAALLHQAGLRPPAAEAALPVFDAVLADIGDQQSIAMSLSTFSGHLTNIVGILRSATARSLVLLDELASGTDPVEGSALAQAILGRLSQQARLTLVTTHYPEVKEWASVTDGALNAATGIDPDTHDPLYRLAPGRPGTSHALWIAERLGLDGEVLDDARGRIVPERLRTAELLAEAEAADRRAAEERAAARDERVEAERLVASVRLREAELEAEREAVRASAAAERGLAVARAERDLGEARAELRALRDEIRNARRRNEEARRAATTSPGRAERERDRRLGAASERAQRAEQALRGLSEPLPLRAPLAAGDPVEAPALGVRGTIATIEGDEAEVVGIAGHRIRIPLARLIADARGPRADDDAQREPAVRVIASARGEVSDELDVRGLRAQEAREAVRAFIDDAALAGLNAVRIVHGRGTGAVRAAIREEVDGHPLAEGRESESADGATLVHLTAS